MFVGVLAMHLSPHPKASPNTYLQLSTLPNLPPNFFITIEEYQ